MEVLCREDEALERVGHTQLLRQVRESVDTKLDPRQSEIIKLRYGLSGGQPLTQRETAKKLGISRSYVSRIEKKALEKLMKAIKLRE
jgi:RNA polymerase sporulation-specific sigma factor